MNFSFLTPVSDTVLAHKELLSEQALGRKLRIHSRQNGIPDLDDIQIAIIGVQETRNDVNYIGQVPKFDNIRMALYLLYPGNWNTNIADLGDIEQGETVEDTYFAVRTAITVLLEKNIIPIIIGGSQDITYANYRAYDDVMPMVNIVSIDTNFDLGDASLP
ncbi:MAG: arginase, partial [Winogradskyella sp.]|nr:arginase [Winogradskyella sp.]